MKLIFVYIEKYRNYSHQSLNLADDYSSVFVDNRLHIQKVIPNQEKEIIFGDSPLRNLTVVVGETGSGKTNLFQLIGMDHYHRIHLEKDSKYLLLWVNEENGKFVAEICNIIPDNIPLKQDSNSSKNGFIKLVEFEVIKPDSFTNIIELNRHWEAGTYIVNCYDRDAFSEPPCFDEHSDGMWNDEYFPRIVAPFRRVNVGIACEHLHEYLSSMPKSNIKRCAALKINAFNWADKLPVRIDEEVVNRQYWTYRDKRYGLTVRRTKHSKYPSAKKQFLHDLLADYALYLRKFAEQEGDDNIEDALELLVKGLISPTPKYFLPDILKSQGSSEDLLKRIEWLGSYIDYRSDDFGHENGLVWQITTDIKDIYNILNSFDDKFFTTESFILPIVEMDFNDKKLIDLFERMTAYRADELGIFTRELLPYQITGISSGEYQYAKTLGAIDEFCVRMRMSSNRNNATYFQPDFILLLDEPEAYMHPELCRRFISLMDKILRKHSLESKIQILMSTHSPFILSDVLPSQVIRLKTDENGYCRILPQSATQTFAAGIHSIMSHEFFLDYTIGEYSRRFLTALMNDLKKAADDQYDVEFKNELVEKTKVVIPVIGDNVLRHYFESIITDLR